MQADPYAQNVLNEFDLQTPAFLAAAQTFDQAFWLEQLNQIQPPPMPPLDPEMLLVPDSYS